jgi:chromosome segregation ATPase
MAKLDMTGLARWACCAFLLLSGTALAQTPDERLREMLRRTTMELRALQDSQATLQATLDQTQHQRDQLQQQLDAINAKLPELEAAAQARGAAEQELAALRQSAGALRSENGALQSGLAKWQTAYGEAAQVARGKEAERQDVSRRLAAAEGQLGVCKTANTKLIAEAQGILHLYQTQGFRSLLLGSYEPVLGLRKVELENTVQDYEDKIRDQEYIAGSPVADAGTRPAPASAATQLPANAAAANPGRQR